MWLQGATISNLPPIEGSLGTPLMLNWSCLIDGSTKCLKSGPFIQFLVGWLCEWSLKGNELHIYGLCFSFPNCLVQFQWLCIMHLEPHCPIDLNNCTSSRTFLLMFVSLVCLYCTLIPASKLRSCLLFLARTKNLSIWCTGRSWTDNNEYWMNRPLQQVGCVWTFVICCEACNSSYDVNSFVKFMAW